MSDKSELNSLKLFGIVFAVFCVSWFKSCQELKYMTVAKTCRTHVSSITRSTGRYGKHLGYKIHYNFINENTDKNVTGYTQTGRDGIDRYAEGQEVSVEYYGDEIFTSRIQGTGSVVWPAIFFIMLAALVVGVIWLFIPSKK